MRVCRPFIYFFSPFCSLSRSRCRSLSLCVCFCMQYISVFVVMLLLLFGSIFLFHIRSRKLHSLYYSHYNICILSVNVFFFLSFALFVCYFSTRNERNKIQNIIENEQFQSTFATATKHMHNNLKQSDKRRQFLYNETHSHISHIHKINELKSDETKCSFIFFVFHLPTESMGEEKN